MFTWLCVIVMKKSYNLLDEIHLIHSKLPDDLVEVEFPALLHEVGLMFLVCDCFCSFDREVLNVKLIVAFFLVLNELVMVEKVPLFWN